MKIRKGDTFEFDLYFGSADIGFIIATLVPGAPLKLTAPAHGLPPLWHVQIEGVPQTIDPKKVFEVVSVDTDTLAVSGVNGVGFPAASVVLRYNAPVDLSSYTANTIIYDKQGGTIILQLPSTAPTGEPRTVLDNTLKRIRCEIPAADTDLLTKTTMWFETELYSGDFVQTIDSGVITLMKE